MEKNYILICGDDWCGLYLNGELIDEDHSLEPNDIFSLVIRNGGFVTSFEQKNCDSQWIEESGRLPFLLEEVVLDHR